MLDERLGNLSDKVMLPDTKEQAETENSAVRSNEMGNKPQYNTSLHLNPFSYHYHPFPQIYTLERKRSTD